METEITAANSNQRNPFTAFVLSFAAPGVGQLYNGQWKKAAGIFLLLFIIIPVGLRVTNAIDHFYGLVLFLGLELAIIIYGWIDAIRQANRQQQYTLKVFNQWYYYIGVMGSIYVLVNLHVISLLLGVQMFSIPTTSNSPTLKPGDFIAVDKQVTEFEYGDMVSFYGDDGQPYIHRLIGKPNDTIDIINNEITINGKPSAVKFIKKGIKLEERPRFSEFEETLPNGKKYRIYKMEKMIVIDSSKSYMRAVVPPRYYYLVGDNRDGSFDSRYTGPVKAENIIGKALYIYWGKSKKRINIDLR